VTAGVVFLLLVMAAELALAARRQSQTFDESCHIFAGYRYWKYSDFGFNSEHPPLVKLLAALPLLGFVTHIPQVPEGDLHFTEFIAGRAFVYSNDADGILFRSRMAVSLLTLGLGLVVFLVGNEMFGPGPALLALALLAFEPNILANGALITTDIGVSCFLLLSVYAFYRYVRQPTAGRLMGAGVAAGLALAAKHSAVLLAPMLVLLAVTEIWRGQAAPSSSSKLQPPKLPLAAVQETGGRRALRLAGALAIIALIAVTVLWAFYGFRFQARPAGMVLNPSFAEYAGNPHHHPGMSRLVLRFERLHLLPEAYTYGFVSVGKLTNETPTFLFGKTYPRGQWFFFPAAVLIKSTIAFLALFLLLLVSPALRRRESRREVLFLAIPPGFYFLVAMASSVNLGIRHVLPVFPFLLILMGAAAWDLATRSRLWAYGVAAVLVLHAASSLHAFPNYLPYSNELFGGPPNTYKLLTDSNVDWGQGLKAMKAYVDEHHVKACWFAYYALATADPGYYGIPCRMLPSSLAGTYGVFTDPVPPTIHGPVFVSASELSGRSWGEGRPNPYLQFQAVRPAGIVGNSILVFEGEFAIPAASAISREREAARAEK
jgi:4-amino-4-deoxy-L-arabinose transferase-like glycosyltransferase